MKCGLCNKYLNYNIFQLFIQCIDCKYYFYPKDMYSIHQMWADDLIGRVEQFTNEKYSSLNYNNLNLKMYWKMMTKMKSFI